MITCRPLRTHTERYWIESAPTSAYFCRRSPVLYAWPLGDYASLRRVVSTCHGFCDREHASNSASNIATTRCCYMYGLAYAMVRAYLMSVYINLLLRGLLVIGSAGPEGWAQPTAQTPTSSCISPRDIIRPEYGNTQVAVGSRSNGRKVAFVLQKCSVFVKSGKTSGKQG